MRCYFSYFYKKNVIIIWFDMSLIIKLVFFSIFLAKFLAFFVQKGVIEDALDLVFVQVAGFYNEQGETSANSH